MEDWMGVGALGKMVREEGSRLGNLGWEKKFKPQIGRRG
jgi:hypothetical protein